MYTEDDFLPLSALQHLIFCERQCALIHIEQQWVENLFTAQGRVMHERVHSENHESRGDARIEYGVGLRSFQLGLVGKADAVEFHRCEGVFKRRAQQKMSEGTFKGWKPFPVEYKRGKPKDDNCDRVQLCAQALCLEEMLEVEIPCGALFYGKIRRRLDVVFDAALRQETENTALRLHQLFESGKTPGPVYSKKCDTCSLAHLCLPKIMGKGRSINRYLSRIIEET